MPLHYMPFLEPKTCGPHCSGSEPSPALQQSAQPRHSTMSTPLLVCSAPRERLFRDRYRLGCEVNFGGSPAVLAVDTKTDLKVVVT